MLSLIIIISILIFNVVLILILKKKNILKTVPIWMVSICIVIFVIGTILMFWQDSEISKELEKRTWAITDGKIIDSEIVGERAIRAEVEYQYKINQKLYRGKSDYNIPGFGSKNYRRKTANIIKNQNPIGSIVRVYFDPVNPENSTLRHGPYWSNYMIIGFGGVLILAGMFGILWWLLIIKFKIKEK
jgi:hypothetical protein